MLNYNHIKSLAKKRGFSLETLGPKIELSSVGFRKAIHNETLSLMHAVRLSQVLRCSLEDILGGKPYNLTTEPTVIKEGEVNIEKMITQQLQVVEEEFKSLKQIINQHLKTGKSQKSQNYK